MPPLILNTSRPLADGRTPNSPNHPPMFGAFLSPIYNTTNAIKYQLKILSNYKFVITFVLSKDRKEV